MERRRFLSLSVSSALAAGTGGLPLPTAAQEARSLVWGVVGTPRHLNPAVQSGIATMMPGAQLFASPLRYDADWQPVSYFAESWSFGDEGRSLTLKLVEGATFHDGHPITSEDVAFSIMAVKQYHPFDAMMKAVVSVDTPAPNLAVIRMSQASPVILLALSPPFCPILPKHVFGDGRDLRTHPRNTDPVGSGAFKFVAFKPDQFIVLASSGRRGSS